MTDQLPCIAIALVLTACGSDRSPDAVVEYRDSAGVEIARVVRLPDLNGSALSSWELTLIREIPGGGGTSPNEPIVLYDPSAGVRFPDGKLAIYDKGPQRLVVFDSSNAVVARYAPQGRGPGEIYSDGVALLVDSAGLLTVVERWGNTRVHHFTFMGELVEDLPLERISGAPWGPGRAPHEITVPVWTPNAQGNQAFVDSLARLDVQTGHITPFAELPDRFVPPSTGSGLFYPIALWTSFPTGKSVVGRTDRGRFHVLSEDGSLERVIDLPISPMPVTEDRAQRVLEEYGSFLASIRTAEATSERFHSHHRLAMRLFTYDDSTFAMGHSWLSQPNEDEDIPGGLIVWRFFDVVGKPRGVVRFPEAFVPWDVQGGMVLGVWTDSLGVPTVRLYALEPAEHR
jgi:hypothetical protein